MLENSLVILTIKLKNICETGNKIDVVIFDLENETEIEQGYHKLKKLLTQSIYWQIMQVT